MAQRNPHRVDLGKALARYMGSEWDSAQLDRTMGWTSYKTSRVVHGTKSLSEKDVNGLIPVLGLTPEQGQELRRLAVLARKRKANQFIADYAASYVSFEQDAVRIDSYSEVLVPGLGQDSVYATAVLSAANTVNVAERVGARIDRQKILTGESPPLVRLLLGEAALYKLVGGHVGLRRQLEHLLQQAESGHIMFGVDRFSTGEHRAMGSRFNIVRRANGDARVYLESARTSTYLHAEEDVEAHQRIFDHVWGLAAVGDESATILRKRIQQLA